MKQIRIENLTLESETRIHNVDLMATHPAPPLIELRHVSVVRAGRVVLHDLNLRIEAGEHVAIMGPNGSGKSTLIKTITREFYPLYDENSSMKLFGQETWNVSELRSMLGIVTNDNGRFLRSSHHRARRRALRIFQ